LIIVRAYIDFIFLFTFVCVKSYRIETVNNNNNEDFDCEGLLHVVLA